MLEMIYTPFFILFPLLTSLGAQFVFGYRELGKKGALEAYMYEAFGGAVSGIFLFILFSTGASNSLIVIVASIITLIPLLAEKKRYIFFACIFISLLFFSGDIENRTKALEWSGWKGYSFVECSQSKYGNIVVMRSEGQISVYDNGILFMSTKPAEFKEDVVHIPMLEHSSPEYVLIVGGGIESGIREALKYGSYVDYVTLDPKLIEISEKYLGKIKSEKVRIIAMDGRAWIKNADRRYDVVIINMPDPSNAQINRYYTVEFYREVKAIMREKGVILTKLSSSTVYMSEEMKERNSLIYSTLKRVFRNVLVVPGDTMYMVASDRELVGSPEELYRRMVERNVSSYFVNLPYLRIKFYRPYMEYTMKNLFETREINSDLKPSGYYYTLKLWLRGFSSKFVNYTLYFLFSLSIILIFISARGFKEIFSSISIFWIGFSEMAVQFILVILFQSLYGYVYLWIVAISSFTMLGIGVGAYSGKRIKKPIHTSLCLFSIYMFLLPIAIDFSFPYLFIFLSFFSGLFPGIVFSASIKIEKDVGALYYISDLIGGSLGSLLVAITLIPKFGIESCSIGFAGISLFLFAIARFVKCD